MKITVHGELNTKVLAQWMWKLYLEDQEKLKKQSSKVIDKHIETA